MARAETKLVEGLDFAMRKARVRVELGPRVVEEEEEDDEDAAKMTERSKMKDLSNAGALPPADDDDDGPKREIDVMSEPPEIDTTRAERPPLVGARCARRARETVLVFSCLSLLSAIVVAIVFMTDLARNDCDASADSIGTRATIVGNATSAMLESACARAKMLFLAIENNRN